MFIRVHQLSQQEFELAEALKDSDSHPELPSNNVLELKNLIFQLQDVVAW